ncbi:MAG: HNH endonuclease [Pseudonocardiaceae bacterium]
MKQLAAMTNEALPGLHVAYWQANWRRDAAPLLDELAASIDHVKAFARGGRHDESNFAAICARCNARKSAKLTAAFLAESRPWQVKGKHGEPEYWDGMSAVFVHLARQRLNRLSKTEREWLKVLEGHLSSNQRAV